MAVGDTHGKILAGLWDARQDCFGGAEVPRTLPRMPDPRQGAGDWRRRPQTFHVALNERIRVNKVRILGAEALADALGRVALLVEGARIVGEPLLNHGVIGIEFGRSGGSYKRGRRGEIVLREVLPNGLAIEAEGRCHGAGAEALGLQRFDLGLLRQGDHTLLPILLYGVDKVPCLRLRAGSWHSQIRMMTVGNFS